VFPDGVEGGLEKVGVADAGNLDGVLEGEEDALAGPGFGVEFQEVRSVEKDLAFGDDVLLATREDRRQRALAGAVGAHDRVDLPSPIVKSIPLRISFPSTATCRFFNSSIVDSV
jgi:hypothetical protein